jgi:murein DD-endopeptidase MepM/ murein hydrolase activator NlpD
VTRGFEAPDGPYGRGHRGLDYAVVDGDPVRAVGDGVVVFAGAVAGNRYVTVLHPNGLRTTSSYLRDVAVSRGRRVVAGTILGTTTARFLLTIRSGDVYLDPAGLIGSGGPTRPRHARLVRDAALR